MDYKEYEEMVETIKLLQSQLEEYKKGDNVVLVDERYDYRPNKFNWLAHRIPKITGNTEKAKLMLQNEFNNLYNEFKNVQDSLRELQEQKSDENNKSWWRS